VATAQNFVDTFAGGANAGGWLFNGFAGTIVPTGGNPDEWLGAMDVDTFGPSLVSDAAVPNPFTGDYVANQVTSLSFDAMSSSDFNTANDPAFSMTVRLRDARGTPADPSDDNWVYFVGSERIPQPIDGWKHFAFDIPSGFVGTLPPGWVGGSGFGDPLPPGVTFADVISNVEQVEFLWLDPAFFAIFQQWDVGADNIAINVVPEPATSSLAILTCIAVSAIRRRR
jgi:hypothetical protein